VRHPAREYLRVEDIHSLDTRRHTAFTERHL
jgi:hypothetical protein